MKKNSVGPAVLNEIDGKGGLARYESAVFGFDPAAPGSERTATAIRLRGLSNGAGRDACDILAFAASFAAEGLCFNTTLTDPIIETHTEYEVEGERVE